MAGANLAFSKVVATPTPTAWSQAYSAGSLFAAISLHADTPPLSDSDSLANLGKDLISTLESEFFTLENKDLESIKQAIATTFGRLKEGVNSSFIVCFLNENVLYLYASGGGKAVLKRGEKIGTVLEGEDSANIKSASGYVQNKDIIILQTKPFQRIIQSATLASSLDKNTPSEITEELAPHVHDKSEGGASAIILSYNEGVISESEAAGIAAAAASAATLAESGTETEPQINEELDTSIDEPESNIESVQEPSTSPSTSSINNDDETIEEEKDSLTPPMHPSSSPFENPPPKNLGNESEISSPFPTDQKQKKKFSLGLKKLPRGRRLILVIAIILVAIIFIASVFALMNMRNSNNEELFNGIYNEAKAKYEEGQSLMELNESLATENLKQAQTILQENKDTFPDGSSEDEQIEALLTQINTALGSDASSGGTTSSSQAAEVEKSQSQFLSIQMDNPDSDYFAQNEDFVYFINSKGVSRVDKGNSEEEAIIDKDWTEEGGIGVFGSNIYVLDKSENIFKFVPSGSDFTKSNYLTGNVDLGSSAAMTIDGSIYVLEANGEINKFTKGAEEDFSVTGLEKPMSSPTRISTTEDGTNIYVLDNGNSRIVVLDKDGKFVKAYSADILKAARDIDPQEANNAIFVLSGNKVYKINTN